MRRRSLAGVLSDSDEAAPEARAQQGRNQLLLAQLRRSLATVAIKDGGEAPERAYGNVADVLRLGRVFLRGASADLLVHPGLGRFYD